MKKLIVGVMIVMIFAAWAKIPPRSVESMVCTLQERIDRNQAYIDAGKPGAEYYEAGIRALMVRIGKIRALDPNQLHECKPFDACPLKNSQCFNI